MESVHFPPREKHTNRVIRHGGAIGGWAGLAVHPMRKAIRTRIVISSRALPLTFKILRFLSY